MSASSKMYGLFCRYWGLLSAVLLVGFLGACSGTASTSDGGGTSTTSTVASLTFLVSSQQMDSDGKTDVSFTILAKDGANAVVANQPVQVTATSGSVVLNAAVTDATGKVTGTLSTLGDPSNRDITLTAISGSVQATNVISVNGTSVQVSGTNSLVFGTSVDLQIAVTDSGGKAISKASVTVASSAGNTLSSQTLVTDATGAATVRVTGGHAGSDTITVSSLGATQSFVLSVSGADFKFTAPTVTSANINTDVDVKVQWQESSVPQAGKTVSFSTTRGTLSAASAVTDASGIASVTVRSSEAGPAIVTATGPGGAPFNTYSLYFNATTASRVELQSDKSNLTVYKANSADSIATISAIVRDATNNLVKGATVNFSLVADPSGGALSNSVATTDEGGIATVKYTAGSTSSGQNAIQVKAVVSSVNGVPVSGSVINSVYLTVGGQSLFVRLGTDNKVASSAPNNIKTWSAVVTDASGNPVPNTTVQFSLRPASVNAYIKGSWEVDSGAWTRGGYLTGFWTTSGEVYCSNEDVNFNGLLESGEDLNGNGQLTPGNVASVNKSAVTDASGVALANVTYPKDYGGWATVTLRATIQVAGSEFTQAQDFVLTIQADDYNNVAIPPPGRLSPFGVGSACSNPN